MLTDTFLHLFRRAEAKHMDSVFQHILNRCKEKKPGFLLFFILFGQDSRLVIEAVEIVLELIDIGTQPMRRLLLKGSRQCLVVTRKLKH